MARRGGDATADPDDAVPDEDPIVAEEQLALAGGEERLPWLESDDDYEEPGVDTGRIVTFAAGGLLVVAAAVAGLWWYLREPAADTTLAEGSVIEAPEEPYRERPEDPGGMQVEGTGQTAFEVAEGEQVEARVAGSGVPRPSIDREQAGGATQDVKAGAVGVQVGAYSTRDAAEAGWTTLSARFSPLQGHNHRVLEGTADGARIFRLQALAGSAAEAETLCRAVKAAGGDCQVKR